MPAEERTTILRPPEADPDKAPIENVLEVSELGVLGPDIFTNTRQQWLPPGARGIYGGSVIAQCLASAQKTVPADFLPHSCHCYFLLAGSPVLPILFHVERVRDGRSFSTRTVQARQRGRCIFTTTVSFARGENDAAAADEPWKKKKKVVRHAAPLPDGVLAGGPADVEEEEEEEEQQGEEQQGEEEGKRRRRSSRGPFQSTRIDVLKGGDPDAKPHERVCRTWMRARGKISPEGGHQAHLNALAYMSDSYFIGTVSRIHGLWRLPFPPSELDSQPPARRAAARRLLENEGMGSGDAKDWEGRPHVGMLVSLDHSIYFHEPRRVRADEWLFSEMESPWAGEERGVVAQRIFAKDGTLLASCMQEGVVRLKQDGMEKGGRL